MQLKKDTYLQGGKYRVVSTLGQGGFGITYLAEQVMAKRMVCIKEFFPKEYYNRDADSLHISLGSKGNAKMMNAYKAKFIKEAQTIAKLKHPNIIPIFDVFEENNTAYYAMEYIEGESLNKLVKREGALAEDRAVKYIRDVASALRHIHNRNIMHLDVKPANIMLSKEDDCAVLIDFGLSKQYDNAGKQTSATPVGISHGYAPMEQYQEGGVSTFSPVTDIYSLGATLYYLVTGRVPAEAATIGENGIGELPRLLSANVRNAITSAMSYWRKERPQSIDIFLAMFDETTTDNDVRDVKEADDTTKIGEADTVVTSEPVTPELTPDTPKSDYDDIYIKPKKSGEKSEKTKKQKSRWWIWLLILIIGGAGFFVLYERYTPHNNTEIWYTSVDGNIVEPHDSSAFDAKIVSNTCTNGKGVIKFDGYVTTIGHSAFEGCTSLTSVNIPDSVTTIGYGAFEGCTSLTSVNIPDSVTSIGSSAFCGCTSLTSVNIPDSVTTIGSWAFLSCDSLTSVNIPDSVTAIGGWAFYSCDSLTSVNIPDSVTTIGECAFSYCTSLTEFTGKFASEDGRCLIIDGVLNSFAISCGVTEYTIPDSVTTIGIYAFASCDSLTSVNIGDSVTTIGSSAFSGCTSLTSVNIPDSVTSIGYRAFYSCDSLTSVNIPDSVTTIGESAFDNCDSLPSVNIGDSVTTIGNFAFSDCGSLTSVNIPDSVTSIEICAFSSCDSLTSVTIGDSVTTIGDEAFYYCTSLTSVYCKATTPPSLGDTDVFDNNGSGRKIYVPAGSVNAYKSADGWSEYADAIVGFDFFRKSMPMQIVDYNF